jgi:hypothetical protein
MNIAANDPQEQNKERFSDLFAYARDAGILSETQARNEYQRYFTTNFVSLGNDYNNCSSTCQEKQAVEKKLKNELGDKNQGLLQVTGDRTEYAAADKQYNQLLTLIEATCSACQESKSGPALSQSSPQSQP